MMPIGSPMLDPEPLRSPVAEQLRSGFPWLRFIEPLESEFRRAYRVQTAGQVRLHLWLAFAVVLAFGAMDQLILGRGFEPVTDLLRYGIVLPLVLVALVIAYSPLYEQVYSGLVQVLAPLAGACVVAYELILVKNGASSLAAPALNTGFAALVLTTIYLYLLAGLQFYAATRSALVVFAAYVAGAVYVYPDIEAAAYNSLVLGFANVIGAVVCYTLERTHRTSFLEARLLTEMASRDGLTGIWNRRMLDEHLDRVWREAARERLPVALLLVDIDHFKAYNDYYGHQAGDECLKRVALTLARSARRPLDFTARYGGEEFAIVLYNARREYVEEVTQRIRTSIEDLAINHPASPIRRQLTVSIGAACVAPMTDRSCFGFVQLADEALYEAKDGGRDRVVIKDREYETLSTGSFRKAASDSG